MVVPKRLVVCIPNQIMQILCIVLGVLENSYPDSLYLDEIAKHNIKAYKTCTKQMWISVFVSFSECFVFAFCVLRKGCPKSNRSHCIHCITKRQKCLWRSAYFSKVACLKPATLLKLALLQIQYQITNSTVSQIVGSHKYGCSVFDAFECVTEFHEKYMGRVHIW